MPKNPQKNRQASFLFSLPGNRQLACLAYGKPADLELSLQPVEPPKDRFREARNALLKELARSGIHELARKPTK
jgi:hypothetical protein